MIVCMFIDNKVMISDVRVSIANDIRLVQLKAISSYDCLFIDNKGMISDVNAYLISAQLPMISCQFTSNLSRATVVYSLITR